MATPYPMQHVLIAALKIVAKGVEDGTVVLDPVAKAAVADALAGAGADDTNKAARVLLADALSGPFKDDPAGAARAYTAVLPLVELTTLTAGDLEWRERERIGLRRLKQLLSDFEIRVENNPLQPPMTYLEEVQLSREFQPGQGNVVADALRGILSDGKPQA